MKRFIAALAAVLCCIGAPSLARAEPPSAITFTGTPSAPISSGVVLPAGTATYLLSGIPPAAPSGGMKAQAESVLQRIDALLKAQGLSLRDVVFFTVYVVPDKTTGVPDYKGWFDAYAESFGTAANPTKPARSTVGVASLGNPGWLIEISAVAAFPPKT